MKKLYLIWDWERRLRRRITNIAYVGEELNPLAPPLSKMKAESSARSLFSKVKEKQRKLTRNFLAK